MLSAALVALLSSAAQQSPPATCQNYVGQTLSISAFDEVRGRLPTVAARSRYETTADYERRLASAASPSIGPVFIQRREQYQEEGLSYNADRGTLAVYRTAFGAGGTDYTNVFGRRGREDNFASAIAFQISVTNTSEGTYETTNGFGAPITVTRTERQVNAIWERAGSIGENPFVDMRGFGPVATLRLAPEVARDLIEHGSVAFLLEPRPPFTATGSSIVEPSFSRPRERRDTINVIIADVRCGFLLNGQGRVAYAFEVK